MKLATRRFLIRCASGVVLLMIVIGQASAQLPSPPPIRLLELKSCGRTLTVFDDRTVVESFSGGETRRQLTEKQMKKLQKVIASDPCERRQSRARQPTSTDPTGWKPAATRDECDSTVLGYGPGLMEIFVTRHHPERDRDMVVYIPCGKEKVAPHVKRHVNPKWKKFIHDVMDALGGKSLIEACGCRH